MIEALIPELISRRLHTHAFGRVLHHFETIDSTNAFASRLLAENRNAVDGTLILAESQSAGRGRAGRHWFSEKGNGLYLSLILRPETSARFAPLFTLACAVALHDAVEKVAQVDVDIKWPNDLLVGGKKVAGILAEIESDGDRIRYIVMGVGLNVNHESLPTELSVRGTSLRLASGRAQSRLDLLVDFLERFESVMDRIVAGDSAFVIADWSQRSTFTHGRRVEISDGYRTIAGVTCGLTALGGLRVETGTGSVEDVYSGDVLQWDVIGP